MNDSLALKYRPRTFDDVIGQNLTATFLSRLVAADDVPVGLLFSGPSGSGKTTVARVLAGALNPSQADDIVAGSSVDVHEIDAASNGGVADIRRLLEVLRYEASPGANRVTIMDECHNITREGWNALLKPLEEGAGSYFVFVTTEPEKIPGTVLSRLTEFEFRRVSPGEIYERMQLVVRVEDIKIQDDLLRVLATQSHGNVRTALASLDLVWRSGITTADEYADLRGEKDYGPTLLNKLQSGNHADIFAYLDELVSQIGNPSQISLQLTKTLRDLLVLRSGGELTVTGEALQLRKNLALSLEPERILAVNKVMWDLKTRVRGTQDGLGELEAALILISEVLTRGRTAPQQVTVVAPNGPEKTSSPVAPKRLSLADLQRGSTA